MESFLQKIKSFADDAAGKNNLEETQQVIKHNFAVREFKLPIDFLKDKIHPLGKEVVSDLEMVRTIDSSIPSIYECLCSPDSSSFAKQILPLFQDSHTSNITFLKETQQVIENMETFYDETNSYKVPCDTIEIQWNSVKNDPKFMETYGYLDWDILKSYNKNAIVLQSISFSNMISPIMSLLVPFLFILFPFVILKIQGTPITLTFYFKILKEIAKNHFIGQALTTFDSFSMKNFLYLVIMIGLYGFQLYQNTQHCLRFYKNIENINTELCCWKQFLSYSSRHIDEFVRKNKKLESYSLFIESMEGHRKVLREINTLLEAVHPFSCSITKTTEVGHLLKCYYVFHTNPEFEKTILFVMGLEGYLQIMKGIWKKLQAGEIHKTTFATTSTEPSEIVQQYYAPHSGKQCVKNNVDLDIYGVITGPNASGKTTYLKTTAINIILSQQFGVGFFESCTMRPYEYIHSYLNIPDTSGRDSLFQAESRRCKEILDTIDKDNQNRHFCIFDELFSGTNPHEATKSAHAFIEYLRSYTTIHLFLTTHYVSMCDKWEENEEKHKINNYKMKVNQIGDKNVPTYLIEPGISHIEGALGILKDMDYPQEMIAMIEEGQ